MTDNAQGSGITIAKIVLDTSQFSAATASVVTDSNKAKGAIDGIGTSIAATSQTFNQRVQSIIPNARSFVQEAGNAAKQTELLTKAQLDGAGAAIKASDSTRIQTQGLRELTRLASALHIPGAEGIRIIVDAAKLSGAESELQGTIDSIAGAFRQAGGTGATLADVGTKVASVVFPGMSAGLGALIGVAAPFIALFGVGVIAFKTLYDTISAGNDAVNNAITGLQAYYNLVATGTNDSLTKEREKQQIIKDSADKTLADAKAELKRQTDAALQNQGAFGITGLGAASALPGIKVLADNIAQLQKTSDAAKDKIHILDEAIGSPEVAANDARLRLIASTSALVTTEQQYLQLTQLSSAAAKQRVADERALRTSNEQARDILIQSGDTSLAVKAKIEEYNKTITDETQVIDFLTGAGKRMIATREAEAKADADIIKTNDALVAAIKKRDADEKAINEKADADKIALDQKTATTIAGIIQKEIDAQDAALQKLSQAKEDLGTSDIREQGKQLRQEQLQDIETQIKDHNTLRDDLIAHLRKVRDINQQDQAQTNDALTHRNFLQLFQLQEQHKEQLASEDQAYSDKQADDKRHQQDDAKLRALDRVAQANEQRIAIQQKLDDLNLGYQRELQQAHDAKVRELDLANQASAAEYKQLTNKLTAELTARANAAKAEIAIITQTELQKQKVYAAALAQANALAPIGTPQYQQAALTQVANQHILGRATGGPVSAGDWFMYNERAGQRESFNGVKLPAGAGLAFAGTSGNVSPGGSGGDMYNINVQVPNAMNPDDVAAAIEKKLDQITSRKRQ